MMDPFRLWLCMIVWSCVRSQLSGSGQEGCVANVSISTSDISVVHVPPGPVCIQCAFDGVLATDAEFQIDNKNIDEGVGRVDDGVLVVYNTENVFSTSLTHTLKCTSNSHLAQALVYLDIFRAPVIRGETILNEGDTLDLDCDPFTSSPLPSIQWYSPQGDMISNSRDLEIMNIQRSAMGIYTCVATQLGAALNSTTNVIVQFFRPPVITGETTLNEGDPLNLDCNVSTSSPLPSVQWFSPQGDIISNSRDLKIMNIQRSAMGVYTCVATQSGATLNSTTNVIVQFFRPPVITGETTLNEGDTLNLDCNVSTSSPLPSVQWFSPQGDMISNDSDLEIIHIQKDKAGIYICMVIQLDSGETLNSTVNVNVLYKSTSISTWMYVVAVMAGFMILVTLLAVTFLLVYWKHSLKNTTTDKPKERSGSDAVTMDNIAYGIFSGVQTSGNLIYSTVDNSMKRDI